MFIKKSKFCSACVFLMSFLLLIPNSASAVDLVNVSTRGKVGTGEEIMVVGFIVEGSGTKQFFLSAVGPTLSKFGVNGVLANPKFVLFRDGQNILECDNWKDCPGAELVEAYLGLSGQTLEDSEAADVINLAAGSYTLEVSGVNDSTGIALGTAIEPPTFCTTDFNPVCGFDNQTYSNACLAAEAGVNVISQGECPTDNSCQSNSDCSSSDYCQQSSPGATGMCEVKPTFCTADFDPVCGFDNQNYSNACQAAVAGVNVLSQGACIIF